MIKPSNILNFNESVYYLDNRAIKKHLAFNSRNNIYIYNQEFNEVEKLDEVNKIKALSLHPYKNVIALITESLKVRDFSGVINWSVEGDYLSISYDIEGNKLWCIKRIDNNTLECLVYDEEGNLVINEVFEDELYQSAAHLDIVPNSNEMLLELNAGQDGCITYFIKLKNNQIIKRKLNEHYSYTCCTFNPKGTNFLCIENDDYTIHHFTYPELKDIGCLEFDKECNLDYSMLYLDNNAMISYGGNYYWFNINAMTVVGEVLIEGHLPRAISEIYQLDDQELISDIDYFISVGNIVIGKVNSRVANQLLIFNYHRFNK